MLVNGKWDADWQPVQSTDAKGGFVRQISGFRDVITSDGSSAYRAEAGRYHLFVALICPWASRTLIARALKGLEDVITVSVMEPEIGNQGWRLSDAARADTETAQGATYIHEIYTATDPNYTGRATVPVLWDRQTKTIVNNESADIVRMLNSGFGALAKGDIDLYPEDLRTEIDALNDWIYPRLNNGVYRAGFATTQGAYQDAYADVFTALDALEDRLTNGGPFLFGTRLTETDIRAFVTLIRFDLAYYGLFKANKRQVSSYPALSAYIERVLAVPGVAATVSPDHIKRGYYSIKTLNPMGIVPEGPDLPWMRLL
ncbi:glutathione S-transferase family protein [Ketogulonicigenium vulgare]|uniref:glutathione S-transferase family protein n=1 Tax=Ketogulonicigenium vulgare TaxID=92945 RepID=UPI0023584386|nr:glutathione S-transferase C-terminal domain-containing protein [Ketogulonicigenium vulgare]